MTREAYDTLSSYNNTIYFFKKIISDIIELSDEMLTEISYVQISKI